MSAGETFYGRHTAQHPAAVIRNNIKKFSLKFCLFGLQTFPYFPFCWWEENLAHSSRLTHCCQNQQFKIREACLFYHLYVLCENLKGNI